MLRVGSISAPLSKALTCVLAGVMLATALAPQPASAISIGQWWMGLTAASKAAIIGGAVAGPVAATVINLRNKQRADSAQLQEQAQQRPQATPIYNGQPRTFCVQLDDQGRCTTWQTIYPVTPSQ